MVKDLDRLSKYYQIPFKIPEDFMEWIMTRTTISAQRFLCALEIHAPDHVEEASRQVGRAHLWIIYGKSEARWQESPRTSICVHENFPSFYIVLSLYRAFYQRLFGQNKEIMSLECIPEVAKAANVPQDLIEKCLKAIESDDVKDLLKKYTDEAIDLNAFGAPTIVAHISGKKEMYFGQDRLYLLAHEAGKPWLGPLVQSKV